MILTGVILILYVQKIKLTITNAKHLLLHSRALGKLPFSWSGKSMLVLPPISAFAVVVAEVAVASRRIDAYAIANSTNFERPAVVFLTLKYFIALHMSLH